MTSVLAQDPVSTRKVKDCRIHPDSLGPYICHRLSEEDGEGG